MQRAARALGFALLVEALSDGQSIGIEFDYAVDGWPAAAGLLAIDFFDPGDIFPGEGLRGKFPGCHARLQIGEGELVEFEASNFGRSGCGGRHLAGAGQRRQ